MRCISAFIPVLNAAAFFASTPAAAPDLSSFPSTQAEQGVPLRLAMTETERFPTKSYVNVPGFHDRAAPGTRSPMCYYTALAIEREFSYWFVVYPAEGSNRVVLGFSNSAEDSPEKLLGPDYVKALAVGNTMLSVQKMADLCGIPLR